MSLIIGIEMHSEAEQSQTDSLPGYLSRKNAATWILRAYLFFSALSLALHFLSRISTDRSIDLPSVAFILGIAGTAVIALNRLERSLSRAVLFFAWGAMGFITSLIVYQFELNGYYAEILIMLHIGIFSLGLILGFRAVSYYATVVAVIIALLGIRYQVRISDVIIFIFLAYAAALPAKVVENLINESTAELTRINEMLRAENAERRRAEAELEKHRDHLFEMVEERTVELREEIAERLRAEAALRQRTQELETRNEELDAFAHTVAHDLKNPLTSLVGFGELLESRYDTFSIERIRSTLAIIAQNGRKMTNIINELLLLATVRKAGDVDMAPIDMAHIVAEAQKRSADLAQEHQANISVPDVWPEAWGYGPWIEEVWANYISNAIKYGGRPPYIELGATELANTDTICFWVRDNGNGMTTEEQARLFRPFTRLDQVQVKGHGLGLSIVRRIVEKLDGEVCVESEIGKGSVFSFTLPAINADTPPSTAPQAGKV